MLRSPVRCVLGSQPQKCRQSENDPVSMQDSQAFGGSWTEEKLNRLKEYLDAYITALKKQPFERIYIDAFAGTGYRNLAESGSPDGALFTELAEDEPQRFLDGSVRIALKIKPPFDKYIFIELSSTRFAELGEVKEQFPQLAPRIQPVKGDCNRHLQKLCKTVDWSRHRAVVFLDPFGMQVDWATIESVARTQAIDTWILFPLGAVNRMLTRNRDIPQKWRARLDRVFGTNEWFQQFYVQKASRTLWGKSQQIEKTANFEQIADYCVQRLQSVFAGVANNPLQLCNSKGVPLFLLCFAAGNPRGAPIALRIAQHILGG